MMQVSINNIELADLERLRTDAVLESKTIEYKGKLPSNSDGDRKEFLADISSFANASGGDLIFGIAAKDSCPERLDGVELQNTDQEVLMYENIIRDGIEPRIKSAIRAIRVSDNYYILVFRVEKSWIGPHRVIYKGHDKFYSRNSKGKYPLDTSELKTAFTLANTLVERISRFKTDRYSHLLFSALAFEPSNRYRLLKLRFNP